LTAFPAFRFRAGAGGSPLSRGPLDRPADWISLVNEPWAEDDLSDVRKSVTRGRPFGGPIWTRRTVDRLGLSFTLNGRGRPPVEGKR
jgi:putative transposase